MAHQEHRAGALPQLPDLLAVGALVSTDAGCLMNIAGCLRRRGGRVRALHLAEVLEQT